MKFRQNLGIVLVVPSAVYDVRGHPPSTAAKGNAKVEYEIVTQISVFLDVSSSIVRQMTTGGVTNWPGHSFVGQLSATPLLDNDSTRSEAFWKSTRTVLAANRGLYNKLTGNTQIWRRPALTSLVRILLSRWSHSISSHT